MKVSELIQALQAYDLNAKVKFAYGRRLLTVGEVKPYIDMDTNSVEAVLFAIDSSSTVGYNDDMVGNCIKKKPND